MLVAGIVSGALLAVHLPDARADEPPSEPPIGVTYVAGKGCPSESDFFASVRRYTSRWAPVVPDAGRRVFEMRLEPRRDGHAGTLVIRMPDGTSSTRGIVGPDCASVARGLAVIVALAVDPQANIQDGRPESEPERSAPDVVATEPDEAPPSSLPVAARAEPPPGLAAVPNTSAGAATVDHPITRASASARFVFGVEARAELTTAVTTGALPVIGAAFETRVNLGAAVPSWLTPSLAVGMRQSSTKRISVDSGAADFTWTAATLRLCPVRLVAFASRVEAAPCLEMDLGALRAEPRGLSDARGSSNFWFDRGASVRASYRLTASWAIGAGILVTAPMSRNRYAVSTGELISKAPGAGTTAGLHLELRL